MVRKQRRGETGETQKLNAGSVGTFELIGKWMQEGIIENMFLKK